MRTAAGRRSVQIFLLVSDDGAVGGGVGDTGKDEAVVNLVIVEEALVGLVDLAVLEVPGAGGAGAGAARVWDVNALFLDAQSRASLTLKSTSRSKRAERASKAGKACLGSVEDVGVLVNFHLLVAVGRLEGDGERPRLHRARVARCCAGAAARCAQEAWACCRERVPHRQRHLRCALFLAALLRDKFNGIGGVCACLCAYVQRAYSQLSSLSPVSKSVP